MARVPRKFLAGHCYHVMNRGNGGTTVYFDQRDFDAFLQIIGQAQDRLAMRVLAVCLMPNHFHLVLRPHAHGDLSRWMHWLMTTHVVRYRVVHNTIGRIWQGRFKAFPIQQDPHLHAVMRYVERNALRAGLVRRAEDWPWGSLHWRCGGTSPAVLTDSPCGLPSDWVRWVNEPQTSAELKAIRKSARSEIPFGDDDWVARVDW
ncbi:MAG TPA: transposase [Gammaproteobacteria bacterium]|nr:transposase [Gammaproteobacteria bacterium]